MQFTPTPLEGSYLIDLEKIEDERGFFARLFSTEEAEEHGIETTLLHVNNSLSVNKGTLRGMHYQLSPRQETKVVRCIRGALYDMILDLRKDSPTFGQSFGKELTAENRSMMYIPKGFAHGFLTLEPNTEIIYFVSQSYSPAHERGIRWDDPYFGLRWPGKPKVLSERDLNHPDFDPQYHLSDGPQ